MSSEPHAGDGEELSGQALVARELRRYRERAGLSRNQLASQVGYSRTYVATCEKPGAALVSDAVVRRIDEVLGAGGRLVELRARAAAERRGHCTRTQQTPLPDEGAGPLSFVGGLTLDAAEPAAVGWSEVEQVRSLTASLAAGENMFGGGCATTTGPAALRWATGLLAARASTEVRRGLLEAVGNMAGVVGFIAFDVNDQVAARRLFDAALWCADQGGSWTLRATVLADLARQHLLMGEVDDALSAVEFAQVRSDRLTATARAVLAVLRAQILAELNRPGDAHADVDRADAEFAQRDPELDPPWLSYYDEAEHAGSTAKALMPLELRANRAGPAAGRLATAIDRQTATYPRSRAFSAARLAVLQMRLANPVEAVAAAQIALDSAASVRSHRLDAQLDQLADACRQYTSLTEVADLVVRLAGR